MRPLGSGERDLLRGTGGGPPQYATHKRLAIGNSGMSGFDSFSYVLLEDRLGYEPLLDASWGANANELCGDATFTLMMGRGSKRVTPFGINTEVSESPLGQFGPPCAPFPGRYIQLQTATVPRGFEPGSDDWRRVFDGRIDTVDITDNEVRVGCRDLMCDFVDRWIEHNDAGQFHGWFLPGGNLPVVLDDLRTLLFPNPTEALGHVIVGFGPVPPFTYPGYWQSPMSGAEAMQAACDKVGEVIHMRYGFGGNIPAVTRYDPSYDPGALGVPTDTQTVGERLSTTLKVDRRNVRNRLFGQYGPTRITATHINSDSIAKYGPRYLLFDEDKTSLINTTPEMDDMLTKAAARVNTADVGSQVVRPYFWPVELSDPHVLAPDGHKFDSPLSFRVSTYRHELTRQHERTTITYAENALAAVRRLLKNTPKIVHVGLAEPVGMAPEGAVAYVVTDLTPPPGSSPP